MVFAGVYPVDQGDHSNLAAALEKLCLNDSSVSVRREVSPALGPGWRVGFLGMLHMDVFSQRYAFTTAPHSRHALHHTLPATAHDGLPLITRARVA